jgi:hypothetical protein
MENDKERKVRLRLRKPAARSERPVYASVYRLLMHYARMSSVRMRLAAGLGGAREADPALFSTVCGTRRLF